MTSMDLSHQDSTAKRKILSRSNAVVGDDDNKVKPLPQQETFKKQSSASHSKDSCTDMMGVDVLQFIEDTLHKNAKDRDFLLRTEEDFKRIVANESEEFYFFPEMSSYNRMLVHRVAAFFGFIHNVAQNGKQVVVTKQKGLTRIPEIAFSSLIKHSNYTDRSDRFVNTRRSVQSFDESNGTGRHHFPPFRNFRSRFFTASGDYNGELNRGRRARSFEASDWYNSSAGTGTTFFQPGQQQFMMSDEGGGGGGGMSGNCSSSNASSSAIVPMQLQSIHLPMYQPGMPYASNEASMLSPSSASAYSEPVHSYQPPMAMYNTTDLQHFSEREEETNSEQQLHQQRAHNIPSLLSIQPTPPPQLFYQQQQQLQLQQQYQQYQPQYQPAFYQYQPMMVHPSPASTPNQYSVASPVAYPNYYPVYQPQPSVQPHPLLEENNTRYLPEQLASMNLSAETADEPQKDEDTATANDGQPEDGDGRAEEVVEEQQKEEGKGSSKP